MENSTPESGRGRILSECADIVTTEEEISAAEHVCHVIIPDDDEYERDRGNTNHNIQQKLSFPPVLCDDNLNSNNEHEELARDNFIDSLLKEKKFIDKYSLESPLMNSASKLEEKDLKNTSTTAASKNLENSPTFKRDSSKCPLDLPLTITIIERKRCHEDEQNSQVKIPPKVMKLSKEKEEVREKEKTIIDDPSTSSSLLSKPKNLNEIDDSSSEISEQIIPNYLYLNVIDKYLNCPVCLDLVSNPLFINCGHILCDFCYRRWRFNSAKCPQCRQKIKVVNKFDFLETIISGVLLCEDKERHEDRKNEIKDRKNPKKAFKRN